MEKSACGRDKIQPSAFAPLRLSKHISRGTLVPVRMFAFSYPLLLLAIWTAWLVTGDYVVLETSVRQVLASKYRATTGEIVLSQLGQGAVRRRGLDVRYSYCVDDHKFTGVRYRYDDRNGAFDYKAATKAFPVGSTHTVYYNPANPADGVLSTGLNGCDLLLTLFALPLNIATFMVWVAAIRSRRQSDLSAPAGGVRIIEQPGETRVRLADFSPLAAGFFAVAVAAFAAAMPIVFAVGFQPSLRLMSAALILVAAAGVAAFVWTALRHNTGCYDLRIQQASQTLLLPAMAGRKDPLRVSRGDIVGVALHRLGSQSPSGEHFSYVPALECGTAKTGARSLLLANWGWTEGKASAFATWISQQLRVPFHGQATSAPVPASDNPRRNLLLGRVS